MANTRHDITPHPRDLFVGGVAPFSLTDWPGKLVATLFLQGCPWRCGYCHNPELQKTGTGALNARFYSFEEVQRFMKAREGMLDGIVISGGEPLMQPEIIPFIKRLAQSGVAVGLHTGGAYPDRLAEIQNDLAWVGFDYKTLFERYDEVVGGQGWGEQARTSLNVLVSAATPFETRTTVDETHFDAELLAACERELRDFGVSSWYLQVRNDATKKGALTQSALSRLLIEDHLASYPASIARLRNA